MPLDELTQTGVVQPDGSLSLDAPLELSPGPVVVIIQRAPTASSSNWWDQLQETRRRLEALGYPTMTEQEVDSHIEWLRGDDDRIERVYRELEEARRRDRVP